MEKIINQIREEGQRGQSHAFILTLNIKDLAWDDSAGSYRYLRELLCRALSSPNGIVIRYSIPSGVRLYYNGSISDVPSSITNMFVDVTKWKLEQWWEADIDPWHTLSAFEKLLFGEMSNFPAITLVIENAEFVAPNVSAMGGISAEIKDRAVCATLLRWGTLLRGTRNKVVLMVENRGWLFSGLLAHNSGYSVISVPFPEEEERKHFLRGRLNQNPSTSEKVISSDEHLDTIAHVTQGLRLLDLEDLFNQALQNAAPLSKEMIDDKKKKVIESFCHGLLEFVESPLHFEQSTAQPHVVGYLKQLKAYDDLMARGEPVPFFPKGILFVGVPGNGKSHLAMAYASESGRVMVKMKNIRSMWVGETERNLETVLEVLPQLGNAVVFIDEIDQAIASRGGGMVEASSHEVEQRMLGKLLAFMGDNRHRGKVLWIGATNRPDLIDMAMLRRFDKIIPFMNPTQEGRRGLLNDLMSQHELQSSVNLDALAEKLADQTCDAIEKILLKAMEIEVRVGKGRKLLLESVEEAIATYKPNHNQVTYEILLLKTIEAVNFTSDLPWPVEGFESNTEIPECIRNVLKKSSDGKHLQVDGEALKRELTARRAI